MEEKFRQQFRALRTHLGVINPNELGERACGGIHPMGPDRVVALGVASNLPISLVPSRG